MRFPFYSHIPRIWSHRYEPLSASLNSETKHANPPPQQGWLRICFFLLASLALLYTGFFVGTRVATARPRGDMELSDIVRTFHYDARFGGRPSNDTDTAWHTLFPAQGGFFKHPTIAPKRSAFAVFHQLHCLDGIRKGYWAVHDAAIAGSGFDPDKLPLMIQPLHMRHCVDLLRQSLMCSPDLTVEERNDELGGVTGFGTEHTCRSWDGLLEWTKRWEGWNGSEQQGLGSKQQHEHGGYRALGNHGE